MQQNGPAARPEGHGVRDRWLYLVEAIERLRPAHSLEGIVETVRLSARRIAKAGGVTFVLRDGESCHYVAENAISPLWSGQRFPCPPARDGPPVAPPKKRGLGALLIERSLGPVGGSARLDFPASGAVAKICLPLQAGVHAYNEAADERH